MLTKRIIDGDNMLLMRILRNIREVGEGRWNQLLVNYLEVVGVGYNELETLTKGELWRRIRDYDNREWFNELDRLTDRDVYKANRKSVGGSWGYNNSEESNLFRARSNTLKVNSWNRHLGGIISCGLCNATL